MNNTTTEPEIKFPYEEWRDLGDQLQDFHSIFQTFWRIGKPRFAKDVKTAAVAFDRIGDCIDFMINPEFWASLDNTQKLFVICHEVTHVMFYHGFRINKLAPQTMAAANLALDVCVNHFLTDNLGFSRKEVDPEDKFCWIDTVFQDPKKRPMTGKNFEYYYLLVMSEMENNARLKGMDSMDDHSGLGSFIDKAFEKLMKEELTATEQQQVDGASKLKDMVKKELEDVATKEANKEAGISAGNSWVLARVVKVIKKRKWETVIKQWAQKFYQEVWAEQWQKPHRRLVALPKDFMIPAEQDTEELEKHRIPVWFFQDTSGSCAHLADRFFNAALTLPEDRFDVKMHCFDTRVYPTDLKSKKLYGFGGTTFTCIEEFIQAEMKKNRLKYPEAVFLITDGYGDVVKPEKANRWYWFLSEQYKACIPATSKTYDLKDFE